MAGGFPVQLRFGGSGDDSASCPAVEHHHRPGGDRKRPSYRDAADWNRESLLPAALSLMGPGRQAESLAEILGQEEARIGCLHVRVTLMKLRAGFHGAFKAAPFQLKPGGKRRCGEMADAQDLK